MKVSVVIAAYNAKATLRECLNACLNQTHPAHEVIVVDDGSTDGTRSLVEQMIAAGDADTVIYVQQANAGPAAARNRGARVASGDLIAFTDSDCVPAQQWLEQLLEGFTDDTVAGVGGTYDIANPQSFLARIIHEEIVIRHAYMPADVDFLGSFNVAYRKTAFDAVGGFDESFTAASGEDNDLAYRVLDQGGRLCFTHDAVVAHYHPARFGRYLRAQYRHGYWRVKLYVKHRGRMRGDRYAGPADLMAPPLALVAVASPLMLPVTPGSIALLSAVPILLYLALQGPKGWPMRRALGWKAVAVFPVFLFLRDVARGLGLIRGGIDFVILKKDKR